MKFKEKDSDFWWFTRLKRRTSWYSHTQVGDVRHERDQGWRWTIVSRLWVPGLKYWFSRRILPRGWGKKSTRRETNRRSVRRHYLYLMHMHHLSTFDYWVIHCYRIVIRCYRAALHLGCCLLPSSAWNQRSSLSRRQRGKVQRVTWGRSRNQSCTAYLRWQEDEKHTKWCY